MSINITMPALSPTMEEGTLAKCVLLVLVLCSSRRRRFLYSLQAAFDPLHPPGFTLWV